MIRTALRLLLVAVALGLGTPSSALAVSEPGLVGHLPVPEAWTAWKARFVTPEGRVIDDANGSVSHSEGQGYGLVLAVAADDRETFGRIWAWTRAELMLRDDGLAAWRWQPNARPHVRDRNNATDGDLLIAWALIEAAEAWNDPAFDLAGRRIAAALLAATRTTTRLGPVLLPGAVGFTAADVSDGPLVDPSYLIFPAYDRLARAMPDLGWAELRATADRLIGEARFGPAELPPDWLALGGDRLAPAAGRPAVFGWDALRVPLHLAWTGSVTPQRLAPWSRRWGSGAVDPRVVDLASGRDLAPFGEPGYRAVTALVACAVDGTRWPDDLRTSADESYYPATLRLLALVAMSMRHPTCW